jgi:osmotically-inducible protein OsmY
MPGIAPWKSRRLSMNRWLGLTTVLAMTTYAGLVNAESRPIADSRRAVAAGARDAEMLVELALLADPVTFKYPLRLEMNEHGMTLHGYVPHQQAHDRALAIAREVFGGDVRDQLTVHPNMSVSIPLQRKQLDHDQVYRRLASVVPDVRARARVSLVSVGHTSTVVLAGHADSLSQKLELSRCLRGLPGCDAVVNQLQVRDTTAQPFAPPSPKIIATSKPRVAPVSLSESPGQTPDAPSDAEAPLSGRLAGVSTTAELPALTQPGLPAERSQVSASTGRRSPSPNTTGLAGFPMDPRTRLQTRVKESLGDAAEDVKIRFDSTGGIHVLIRCHHQSDVQQLSDRVRAMVEFRRLPVTIDFLHSS